MSGLDAVELVLASGRRFRVGTDEPSALVFAITQAKGRRCEMLWRDASTSTGAKPEPFLR